MSEQQKEAGASEALLRALWQLCANLDATALDPRYGRGLAIRLPNPTETQGGLVMPDNSAGMLPPLALGFRRQHSAAALLRPTPMEEDAALQRHLAGRSALLGGSARNSEEESVRDSARKCEEGKAIAGVATVGGRLATLGEVLGLDDPMGMDPDLDEEAVTEFREAVAGSHFRHEGQVSDLVQFLMSGYRRDYALVPELLFLTANLHDAGMFEFPIPALGSTPKGWFLIHYRTGTDVVAGVEGSSILMHLHTQHKAQLHDWWLTQPQGAQKTEPPRAEREES